MTDDVTLPGTAAVVATDDCSSRHVQLFKLAYSANGVATLVQADADGLLVNLGANNDIIVASGFTVKSSVTLPGSGTGIYTINDIISDSASAPTAGGFTLTGMARASGGSGIITDAVISNSNPAATSLQGEILLFDQAVTNVNDNNPCVLSDPEVLTYVGKIEFTLESMGANNQAYHAKNLSIGYTCVGTANLRYLVRAKNAYTPVNSEVIGVMVKGQFTS